MIVFKRAVALLLWLSLARCVLSLIELKGEQRKHYEASLRFQHTLYAPGHEPVEYLDHLLPAHPTIEADAWQFAGGPGNGAILLTMDGKGRNFFATTRIPTGTLLSRKWNLNWPGNTKDAYALWHIKKKQHKLLSLTLWPPGANPPQEETLESILERIR
ncbi:uncharacterized protein SRS1_25028 [Sporisorium reilianum f. sp. reilianum]|uniref:Uncharacterized protein n=1 Tax=Sporisorium reilianum f. sp. reilianum TaxID=72559 RepID=A0A2N8UCC8_9BASI|nr:uncharacterized protein SRS1_25028 [Sporisorium reilianum f. sp. reilianum]